MKNFKDYLLTEIRRNSKENKYINNLESLRPYKDNPNIYISFTKLEKIGINPGSEYNTPNGIYTYHLKTVWDIYQWDKYSVNVPFAGDMSYIQVLEYNGKEKFISNMDKYTQQNLEDDIKKINDLLPDNEQKISFQYVVDMVKDRKTGYLGAKITPFYLFWTIGYEISIDSTIPYFGNHTSGQRWNNFFRTLGYVGVLDNGTGVIYSDEPYQAVFFQKNAVNHVKTIFNASKVDRENFTKIDSEFKKIITDIQRGKLDPNTVKYQRYPIEEYCIINKLPRTLLTLLKSGLKIHKQYALEIFKLSMKSPELLRYLIGLRIHLIVQFSSSRLSKHLSSISFEMSKMALIYSSKSSLKETLNILLENNLISSIHILEAIVFRYTKLSNTLEDVVKTILSLSNFDRNVLIETQRYSSENSKFKHSFIFTLISEGDYHLLNLFLINGIQFNKIYPDEVYPLFEIMYKYIQFDDPTNVPKIETKLYAIENLIKSGANINYYEPSEQKTAVTLIFENGEIELLKKYKDKIDFNQIVNNKSLFQIAVEYNRLDILNWLINDIKIEVPTQFKNDSNNPYLLALTHHNDKLITFLKNIPISYSNLSSNIIETINSK